MRKNINNLNASDLKIIIGYHKPYFMCKDSFVLPVQGGRAVASIEHKDGNPNSFDLNWLKRNTIGDDTGDNISNLNRNFNEMTIEYWVWKNYQTIGNPDYIGFMQYRRHLILNPEFNKMKRSERDVAYAMFRVNHPNQRYFEIIGLNKPNIISLLNKYDVILTKKANLSLLGISSMREDYEKLIPGVNIKDLDNFTTYLKKINPEFGNYFEKKTYEPRKHLYLCFITSKKIFIEYAEFVFPILFEFNRKLDVSNYSVNGKRTIGYLAETLYGIYFDYMKEKKSYRLKEVDVAMIQDEKFLQTNKYHLYFKFCKYWLFSKIFWGNRRNKYKQKRRNIKNELTPMMINDKRY